MIKGRAVAVLGFWLVANTQVQAAVSFEEVTQSSGISYSGESYGISWGDLNIDGWPDAFVNNHRSRPSLYLNRGDGTFVDVALLAERSGIFGAFPKSDQHGAAWADIDNDADQDLLILNGGGFASQFYINDGGLLTDYAVESNLDKPLPSKRTPVWFDWDRDGLLDLVMSDLHGSTQTLQRRPDLLRYNNVTATLGVTCNQNQFQQISDVVGDGRFELLCHNKAIVAEKVYDTAPTPFAPITGTIPGIFNGKDAVVADFDNNGRADILAVRSPTGNLNDALLASPTRLHAQIIGAGEDNEQTAGERGFIFSGTDANLQLTLHQQGLLLTSVFIGQSGINPSAHPIALSASDPNTWGIKPHSSTEQGIYIGYDPATGDWTVSQSLSEYTTYVITSDVNLSNVRTNGFTTTDGFQSPVLIMNFATGFVDRTSASGFGTAISCISVVGGDFDNDMDIDLYFVCRRGVANLDNILYENQGNGTFVRIPGANGAPGSTLGVGENVATADFDADGFLDLMVTNGLNLQPPFNNGPTQLYRNLGNANHWIELDLEGTVSNRDGIGAKVYATAGGVTQLRQQDNGIHRWSQNHQRVHFGLAGNAAVDLRVEWPSGVVHEFPAVAANQIYRISESGSIQPVVLQPVQVPEYPLNPYGMPDNVGSEAALHVWKELDGSWRLRAAAGGSPVAYIGSVVSSEAFTSVTPFSLESNDKLDLIGNSQFNFLMNVNAAFQDGVDFSFPADADVCLALARPTDGRVLLGAARQPIPGPLNLRTLEPCDPPPQISVQGVSVSESAGTADFLLTLSAPSTTALTVGVVTQDGTALAGSDYAAVNTTVTFQPGETARTVAVTLMDDTQPEGTESFTLHLTTLSQGVIVAGTATATLQDNELVACGAPSYNPATETGVLLWRNCTTGEWFVRFLPGGNKLTFTGDVVADAPFTSVAGFSQETNDVLDFTTNPQRIDYSQKVSASGQDGFDFRYPPGANACFTLSGPSSVTVRIGPMKQAVPTPLNLETLNGCASLPPTVQANAVSAGEGDGNAVFTVTLSRTSELTVSVDYHTEDGSAVAGQDYTAAAVTTLTFAPGETSKQVSVPVLEDGVLEGNETFSLRFANPQNAALGNDTAVAMIIDNEPSPCGAPVYNAGTEAAVFLWKDCATGQWFARYSAGGGSREYVGELVSDRPYANVTPFSIETADVLDSATDPNRIRYRLKMSGSGQDGFNFTPAAQANMCFELGSPAGVTVFVGAARVARTPPFSLVTLGPCNVVPPTVQANAISAGEGNGSAVFTVTLSRASDAPVSVDYQTEDGSAVAGQDYTAAGVTTLTFAPGEISKQVSVAVLEDSLMEGDETFSLRFTNPQNATLGSDTAVATITDNEASACGAPAYDPATDAAVILRKDCATGRWFARYMAGGGSRDYRGNVVADAPFANVTPFNIEGVDVVNATSDPSRIDYRLKMNGSGQDGFDFTPAAGSSVCFAVTQPTAPTVLVGSQRTPLTVPFDLDTLGPCGSAAASGVESGATIYASGESAPDQSGTIALHAAAGTTPSAGMDITFAGSGTLAEQTFEFGLLAHTEDIQP